MKMRLLFALAGLAIGLAVPTFAQQKEATACESASELKPPPTVGDHFTQALPDRHVTFRLFARHARDDHRALVVPNHPFVSKAVNLTSAV
jgi:hypothetical protein